MALRDPIPKGKLVTQGIPSLLPTFTLVLQPPPCRFGPSVHWQQKWPPVTRPQRAPYAQAQRCTDFSLAAHFMRLAETQVT